MATDAALLRSRLKRRPMSSAVGRSAVAKPHIPDPLDESDPRPLCERCKTRYAEVIVAGKDPRGIGALATGIYLCRQCWGRV